MILDNREHFLDLAHDKDPGVAQAWLGRFLGSRGVLSHGVRARIRCACRCAEDELAAQVSRFPFLMLVEY